MELNAIFDRLWSDYSHQNPSALKIHNLFVSKGERVVNDHIAFRTLGDSRVNIDVVSRPFVRWGYEPRGEYFFKDKHLYAKHFEIPGNDLAPRIFISELVLDDVAPQVNRILSEALEDASHKITLSDELIFTGDLFTPLSYETYLRLLEESEYAAWFYVFGFRANHFTVSVNALKKYNTLEKVNHLLKHNGFNLNQSGGEIKGTSGVYLRQSSTMADVVEIMFREGVYQVPCCYYEFAQRYPLPEGRLFGGFVAKSADKIFESTNNIMAKK